MVGEMGTVHAVDIQGPLLAYTQQRVATADLLSRVRLHHAGAYNLPLADDSVDLAVLIATLGEIPDKLHALAEVARVLKSGGRIAISEELPDPSYVNAGAVSKWLEAAGFEYGGKSGQLLLLQPALPQVCPSYYRIFIDSDCGPDTLAGCRRDKSGCP